MKVNVDLSKKGLAMFYRPYEVIGWDVVWNSPEAMGSGAVWEKTNAIMAQSGPGEKKTISRASVIFFLNRQVDLGLMAWKDETGKGGHHRLYSPLVDLKGLTLQISRVMSEKVRDLLIEAKNYDARKDAIRRIGIDEGDATT